MATTVVGNQPELSIPSFLCKTFNEDFAIGGQIGQGGLGTIYACKSTDFELNERSQSEALVVKVLAKNIGAMTASMRAGFYQEVSLMWLLRDHPNIAKLFGYSNDPVGIIMKYYELGDLSSYIQGKSKTQFPYTKMRVIVLMKQFAGAIGYMHYLGLAHTDVKPQNVLLDVANTSGNSKLVAVVTDFGIARVLTDSTLSVVNNFDLNNLRGASVRWAAPEVLYRLRYNVVEKSADVWKAGDTFALSICLLQAMARNHVWPKN